jgi:hypothetical protein
MLKKMFGDIIFEKISFKKIFTTEQLSLFLQIGALINVIGLFLDLIIYHEYANSTWLQICAENLNHLSVFMICLVIIPQALILFLKNHQKLLQAYPIATMTTESCMAIFFLWVLTIENDIEGKFIIFYSSVSRSDHSYRIIFILITIALLLMIDFYKNLEDPEIVDDASIPSIVQSSFGLVVRKHLLLLLFVYGVIHFKKIHKFSIAALNYSRSELFFNLTLLEIVIPIVWIAGFAYYAYIKIFYKQQFTQTKKP